jgi:hypothetical protein
LTLLKAHISSAVDLACTESLSDNSNSLHFGIHRYCGYWSTKPFIRNMILFTFTFGHVGKYVTPNTYTEDFVAVCSFVFHTFPHLSPVSIIFSVMAGNIPKEFLDI